MRVSLAKVFEDALIDVSQNRDRFSSWVRKWPG